jgi:putative transposase
MWQAVLLRPAYLGVTNAFALLRLLPISDHQGVEVLTLQRQITVLGRHLPRTSLGSSRRSERCW